MPSTLILSVPLLLNLDPNLVIAGLVVGLLVGLTGMGGGALLTPLLVLVFGVPPLAAVSSDLVVSLVMKPFGGAVHLARGTVDKGLLRWLVTGSIPAAFIGSVIIGLLGRSSHAGQVQGAIKLLIAVALLAVVAATIARLWSDRRAPRVDDGAPVVVRPLATLAVGAIGGLAVGLSSVGAGTLIIAMLLTLYPRISPRALVGTDLVQAIPLVASAALGHALFGQVQLPLTASLLVGAIPAVILGARWSSSASPRVTRPVVSAVLSASALALLHAPALLVIAGAFTALALTIALQWPAPGKTPDAGPSDTDSNTLLPDQVLASVGLSRANDLRKVSP